MDGGLDLDFYGFTRLFHTHNWLSDLDFDLCRRFYNLIRAHQPAPDLIVSLYADEKIIHERLASRDRINIASGDDANMLETLINEWLESVNQDKVLRLDVSKESVDYTQSISQIMEIINGKS
ncbi:MAG TPA: deoxynucleoside kinase, partial [Anaerolineales bacterium]|nr:deoxynucleoside kinase [Anaerolineales bacterium]